MNQTFSELHQPVLLERSMELLRPALVGKRALVIDATLGLGGHSEALLSQFEHLTVLGIDRDPRALELASSRLAKFGERFQGVLATYDQIPDVCAELGIDAIDGVLFDLGVSSMQLDQPERGFAYAQNAPLDMRMNQQQGQTAADLLATMDEAELTRIFRAYGEERYSAQVARAIVREREQKSISTSDQLNELVESVIPRVPGKQAGHPAKRIYQAIRIAVNDELEILRRAIPAALKLLRPGGRIVVLSYHSLEDGIVKDVLQSQAQSSTPIELPIELPGTAAKLRILTRGVERSGEMELSQNPRAASARLRAAEKLEEN